MNARASAVQQRVLVALSGTALVVLVLVALLLSIALVGRHNFDEPPVPIELLVAASVLLLLAPGLAWPTNKTIPLLAIAVLVAMAISLVIYFKMWVASCPSCVVGHDDSREFAYRIVWEQIGILGAIAIGITLVGAAMGEALSYITGRRGQS